MHILSIDVGSYSVKYLSSFIERKKVTHVEMSEIILNDYIQEHENLSVHEAQASIVKEIIELVSKPDSKIVFQVDHEMMTTRFIKMPVKNKKKAELMLPFQLEEDIPHSLSEIHYAYKLEPLKNQFVALTELTKLSNFENYFEAFKNKNAIPNILTTEASILDTYFSLNPVQGPFCVLDLGHKTSKCYFFYNSKLLVTHVSFIGGKSINEMIAKTYQIDQEEAVIYKHQNAFVLTQDQYAEVEEAQREFAKTMDHFFHPLISDFKRWKIGLKVNFGLNLTNVYICGGTSNIKNICNYLSEKFEIKVSPLDTFDKVEGSKIDINPKNICKYALVNMLAFDFKKKNQLINLLAGKFAQLTTTEIPLHSLAFIASRTAMVTAVLTLFVLGERFLINKDIETVNSRMSQTLKDSSLNISGRIRRAMLNDPLPVFNDLTKKQRSVRQEVSTLQSSLEIDSLSTLVNLSMIVGNSNATLTEFKSNEFGDIEATFLTDNSDELKKLTNQLSNSEFNNLDIKVDDSKNQLILSSGK